MMNINQKIYKAIQKGLNEALTNLSIDDFDEVEIPYGEVESNEEIDHLSGKKEHDEWRWVKDNFVDLGLPSGTLWCKYNLGAKTITDYGDYYAWGNTDKGLEFSMDDEYPGRNIDDMTEEYDAAYQQDHRQHMPTQEQCLELLKCTRNEHKVIDNTKGWIFYNVNDEEKFIFIPFAGYINADGLRRSGYEMTVWTTSNEKRGFLRSSGNIMNANATYIDVSTSLARWCGCSIRPVINKYKKEHI